MSIIPPIRCRHCNEHPVSRPRGLCWGCYYRPEVAALYPSVNKFGRRGVGAGCGGFTLPTPTTALPGTPEKLRVMQERARLKQCLWHPDDATMPNITMRHVAA